MNNKTFKRVVALVASVVMLCSCAFAATIDGVTYADGKLTVNYTAGEGAGKAAIMVKKGDVIVAVNQHDGIKASFTETLDTEKVGANDVLTIMVGDNAAGSTTAASTTFTIPAPVVNYKVTYGETTTEYAEGTLIADVLPKEVPTKDGDAQYSYSFSKWLVNGEEITEGAKLEADITITADFTATVNKYTVKFVNYDGAELQSGEVEYGTVPAYTGETPVKAEDDKYTYAFAGWNPEIVAVTGAATYTATYEATAKPVIPDAPAVKVTFVNGAESTVVEAVDGKVTAPADTVFDKTVNAGYTLTLDSWVTADEGTSYAKGEAIEVNADLTLYAKYLCDRPIGDVNNDGVVNNTDGNAIKYFMVGQRANRQYNVNKPLYEGATILIGDVNNDNVVNNTDGNAIKYFMVGQRANRQYNVNKPLYVINK